METQEQPTRNLPMMLDTGVVVLIEENSSMPEAFLGAVNLKHFEGIDPEDVRGIRDVDDDDEDAIDAYWVSWFRILDTARCILPRFYGWKLHEDMDLFMVHPNFNTETWQMEEE